MCADAFALSALPSLCFLFWGHCCPPSTCPVWDLGVGSFRGWAALGVGSGNAGPSGSHGPLQLAEFVAWELQQEAFGGLTC